MTAETLIADLRARGVTLTPEGPNLRCRPKSALSAEDLEQLRRHKAEVLAALLGECVPCASVVCWTCRGTRFWRSVHGATVCGTCHPPAARDLIVEWVNGRGDENA